MGGAAGHMRHPFDLEDIQTGKDLVSFFKKAAASINNRNPCVKIDGSNPSFKLVDGPNGKEFAVDRASMKEIDISGITKDRIGERFPPGHGMRAAITLLLNIFNEAIPDITTELKTLGLWDDPTVFFNSEYVEGTTNVTEYDENFIAIHGVNQFYERVAKSGASKGNKRPGAPRPKDSFGKPIKDPSYEIPYDEKVLERLVRKVTPIAEKYGFKIYTCIPAYYMKGEKPDFSETLNTNFEIIFDPASPPLEGPLSEWLKAAQNQKFETVTLSSGKVVTAMNKDLYVSLVRDKKPVTELIPSREDVKKALDSAVFWHAMRLLGNDILKKLDSPMGALVAQEATKTHEGVVLRDPKISPHPVKITGEFIVSGMGSDIMTRHLPKEEPPPLTVSGAKVALIPGKFKPPHLGHLKMVEHYSKIAGPDGRVIILVSPIAKKYGEQGNEISVEDSVKIWELYVSFAGLENVKALRSPKNSPVGSAFDFVANEENNPDYAQSGDSVILGTSSKGGDQSRFAGNVEKYAREGVDVVNPMEYVFKDFTKHSDNYSALLEAEENYEIKASMPSVVEGKDHMNFHGSDMRYLAGLANQSDAAALLFRDFIPSGLDYTRVLQIMGAEELEKKTLTMEHLFSLVDEILQEKYVSLKCKEKDKDEEDEEVTEESTASGGAGAPGLSGAPGPIGSRKKTKRKQPSLIREKD